MNRGSAVACERRLESFKSFNEAPIHESGKCPNRKRSKSQCSRFNEAPIHESGKCPRFLPGECQWIASMRPRFMNRGSRSRRPRAESSFRRFNEAPIHESGK